MRILKFIDLFYLRNKVKLLFHTDSSNNDGSDDDDDDDFVLNSITLDVATLQ